MRAPQRGRSEPRSIGRRPEARRTASEARAEGDRRGGRMQCGLRSADEASRGASGEGRRLGEQRARHARKVIGEEAACNAGSAARTKRAAEHRAKAGGSANSEDRKSVV